MRPGLLEDAWREVLVLAAVVIGQAIINWHFASQSFFYADDFVAFQDALSGRYSPDFLFAIHGGHLSPGRRAVTLFLQYHATLDYEFALSLLLVAHSISVVLVQRILRLLFGARWWTLAVAFAYGISIVISPSLQWFSAGVLILPSTTFALAAIHAYLCWWRTGRRAWLVWSAVAVTGGLLFYIKALLVPLYLLLIRVFLLEPGQSLRDGARGAVREWPAWVLYAIPVAAAITTYLVQGYSDSAKGIAWHTIADYFETAWTVGLVPALFGIRVPVYGDATFHDVVIVSCQLGLIGAAMFSIARRRSAWRPWALLVFVFVLNAVLVFPRLGFGPVLGYTFRYFTESVYFAAIVLPFAFARPRPRGPLRGLARPAQGGDPRACPGRAGRLHGVCLGERRGLHPPLARADVPSLGQEPARRPGRVGQASRGAGPPQHRRPHRRPSLLGGLQRPPAAQLPRGGPCHLSPGPPL